MTAEVEILFIVNGEDVPLRADPDLPVEFAKRRALIMSKNTGRPYRDWEARTERGELIPDDEGVGSIAPSRVFLSLMVGCGGMAA